MTNAIVKQEATNTITYTNGDIDTTTRIYVGNLASLTDADHQRDAIIKELNEKGFTELRYDNVGKDPYAKETWFVDLDLGKKETANAGN